MPPQLHLQMSRQKTQQNCLLPGYFPYKDPIVPSALRSPEAAAETGPAEWGYQNRTIGLIENGSWAPNAAKVMQAKFEKSKNITWLDNTVKIMSSLSDENIEELDKMAEELCK